MKIFKFLAVLSDQKDLEVDFVEKIKLSIFGLFMLLVIPLAILVHIDKYLR